ncbi:D-Ala-D-Ala carboxypeptidase family metallohydrolase [Rhodobacter capsulatus]|uniref:D-Ala-D-Ala carboxypeptidase family metallohydrolase n=1 Tax=Rhodobacter capsulatus TaxID=1061 RepID=UPI00402751A0
MSRDPIRATYDDWRDFPLHLWRWPNFSPAELACNGTGALRIDPESLDKLQALRDRMGAPLVINSAYRSPLHNRRVGGAPASQHLQAKAFDIRLDGHDPHELEAAAREVGFTSFGRYHGPRYPAPFLHVDDRDAPAQWGNPWPRGEDDPQPAAPPAPDAAPPLPRRMKSTAQASEKYRIR